MDIFWQFKTDRGIAIEHSQAAVNAVMFGGADDIQRGYVKELKKIAKGGSK